MLFALQIKWLHKAQLTANKLCINLNKAQKSLVSTMLTKT